MVFGPSVGLVGILFALFLYCRVRHDLGWALLEPCKANNFEDYPKNYWRFLGRFSCGMFVSADAAPSGVSLHPWRAGRTFVPRGHRGVGEAFVQEQRGIVSAAAGRGRGRGSGALPEALQGCIDSHISLEISPVIRLLSAR